MKCIIDSAQCWELENLVDVYAKAILEAGFTLERLNEGEDHDVKILIELDSMEDLKKLADVVGHSIVFYPQRFRDDIYSTLVIYDDYME